MTVTGYRTNEDHTQTLAWDTHPDGTVFCDHAAPACCEACVEADSRLLRTATGAVVIDQWPSTKVREGRTVRWRA